MAIRRALDRSEPGVPHRVVRVVQQFGVRFTKGWKSREKWFPSEADRAGWIRRNNGHVFIEGRPDRELPKPCRW